MNLNNPLSDELNFSVFPNPAQSVFTVQFYLPGIMECNILIIDAKGQLIQSQSIQSAIVGWHEVVFDLHQITAGVYSIQVQTERLIKVKKLVIQY